MICDNLSETDDLLNLGKKWLPLPEVSSLLLFESV